MSSIKHSVFVLLNQDNLEKSRLNKWINGFIVLLIILSVAEIIVESYQHIPGRLARFLSAFEVFVVIVFTIEYVLRIWIADLRFPELSPARARWKVMTSTAGLVDLAAILPFYLPLIIAADLRIVRILRLTRLLRIFKLGRHSTAMRIVAQVLREKSSELSITVVVAGLLMLLSAALMFDLEHNTQPDKFPNIMATLWWAIATLTTVGYGDVYPITSGGKILAGIIALLGIGLVALPAGILSGAFMDKLKNEKEDDTQNQEGFKYCPHCGERLSG
jgi:voltage-gated potassium channel